MLDSKIKLMMTMSSKSEFYGLVIELEKLTDTLR